MSNWITINGCVQFFFQNKMEAALKTKTRVEIIDLIHSLPKIQGTEGDLEPEFIQRDRDVLVVFWDDLRDYDHYHSFEEVKNILQSINKFDLTMYNPARFVSIVGFVRISTAEETAIIEIDT